MGDIIINLRLFLMNSISFNIITPFGQRIICFVYLITPLLNHLVMKTVMLICQHLNLQETTACCWKCVCFSFQLIFFTSPICRPTCLLLSPQGERGSYLGAGQFRLGEHQGGGVDRVSQLLFHQLVGLCCLADPGKRKLTRRL